MDARILVPGEADEAKLSRFAGVEERGVRALVVEDPMWILEANHLVMLHEVDAVGAQPLQ